MYAVIETGGKQYRVQEGDIITVEKLNVEAGEKVTFEKVLLLGEGNDIKVGTPYLDVTVVGSVVENGKGQKVIIYKYKSKKDYRKKQGHRQPYTMVQIDSLGGAAPKKAAKKEAKKEVEKETAKETVKEAEEKTATKAKAAEKKVAKEEPTKKVSASMKKDELIAFAKENNIAIDEKATKAVIIEAIEAALK